MEERYIWIYLTALDVDSKSGELPSAWVKNRDIPLRRDEVDPERSLQCSLHAHSDLLHHGATFFFELDEDGTWLRGFLTFQTFRKLSLGERGGGGEL